MQKTRNTVYALGFITLIFLYFGLDTLYSLSLHVIENEKMGWKHFLEAEFFLLFAWRFFTLTMATLTIVQTEEGNQEIKLKHGITGRVIFLIATLLTGLLTLLLKAISSNPFGGPELPNWMFTIGWSLVSILMFCAFTYPWTSKVDPVEREE